MKIKNKSALAQNSLLEKDRKARGLVLDVLDKILENADPVLAVKRFLKLRGSKLVAGGLEFNLNDFNNIYVIGAGKAGGGMAEATESILGEKIQGGVVSIPLGSSKGRCLKRMKFNEATHPVPTRSCVNGSVRMLGLASTATEDDLVIVLLSGGASSLMTLPYKGVELGDLKRVTTALLRAGASISELNAVRKHLSAVGGGRLARACYPATVLSLIISDVVGDRLDVIASGPTAPDPTTFKDALEVLEKHGLLENFPEIKAHLKRGYDGEIPETVKQGDMVFKRVYNFIISTNETVLEEAARNFTSSFDVKILSTNVSGEAKKTGAWLGERLMGAKKQRKPLLILAGGETTVKVRGKGKGGRNQELVLGALSRFKGEGIALASIGTDGIDGVSEAAGAIIDGGSLKKAKSLGLKPVEYLEDNNSEAFFKKLNDLIITGPTGTNVNDVFVAILI